MHRLDTAFGAYARSMLITKYEHACFMLEIDEQRIIVDPGSFSTPPLDLDQVVAVVITHEHGDHWTPEHLTRIRDRNPDARLYAPAGVAAAATGFDFIIVKEGDAIDVGPFHLAFYGSKHALIHSSIPVVENVGVMINDTVFYPGDAYTVPPVPVDLLAVPSSAPWLKIGDVMDYIAAVKPKRCFPTHEMVNSVIGNEMAHKRIGGAVVVAGGEFMPLGPGEFHEI